MSCAISCLRKGAFFSAEDADSPGGEGAFYLWTMAELVSVLGADDSLLAARIFSIRLSGNSDGSGDSIRGNILYRSLPLNDIASSLGIPEPELADRLVTLRERLFAAREKRPRPSRDDKVLADWNGLFIAALAKASRVFLNAEYRTAAERAMAFLLTGMRTRAGGLLHRYRDGEAAIPAFADDYAFVVFALLELYETTFDAHYLSEALALNRVFEEHFLDPDQGGYFSVSDDTEILLARKKEIYDGAVPSANSVACENLIRLSRLTGNPAFEEQAAALARHFGNRVRDNPAAFGWFLCAIDRATADSQEIVIAGDTGAPDTERMIAAVRSGYHPARTVLFRSTSEPGTALLTLAPFTQDLVKREGKATAYLCTGNACSVPITDPEMLEDAVGNKKGET